MNFELFIAKRLNKRDLTTKSLSYLIIRITTVAIALSVATMIISVAIVVGFRSEIENKLSDFVGNILITKHTSNESYQLEPIALDSTVLAKIKSTPGVEYVQVFAIKPGLVKHKNNIQGVVLKGIWHDFNWKFFDQYLEAGKHIELLPDRSSKQVIISKELARIMDYDLNQSLFMFFVENPPVATVAKEWQTLSKISIPPM
jgi:lipoprotein-releasing system permease protein